MTNETSESALARELERDHEAIFIKRAGHFAHVRRRRIN